jgi:acetylornithine deacetylase
LSGRKSLGTVEQNAFTLFGRLAHLATTTFCRKKGAAMSKIGEAEIYRVVRDRRQDLVDLTRHVIQIASVTGSEGQIQAYFADRARSLGLDVDVFEPDLNALAKHPAYEPLEGLSFAGRPNIVAIAKGSGGGRSLILNGHVDTIPVEPRAAWKFEPFSGEIKQDRIFGRGASDMKGGLAVMTMAMDIIQSLGMKLRGDLIFEYVVDEELTGYGTLATILRGYRADAGICLETSDLCVQPACVGRLWFTLELAGNAVSITRHWEGISAIDKGMKFVQSFKDLEQIRCESLSHPLYQDIRTAVPCGVFMFNSGNFPSAVPDRAVLRGSLGLLPTEDVEMVKKSVVEQVSKVVRADPWLNNHPPVLSFKNVGADGAEISVEHPIVRTVSDSFTGVTGSPPVISGRTGGADTRYLIKHGHTPTVIFGPGLTSEMHAVNESVPIRNLEIATAVLVASIERWCGSSEEANLIRALQ